MKMFVADFETAVSKRFDVKFWNKLKSMMDEITKAMENDRLVNHNVQNLAIGFLTDLSLLVHYHYEIPNYGNDISKQLTWTPDVFLNRKPIKSKKNSRVFMAYVLLRMGDLMRYKVVLKFFHNFGNNDVKICFSFFEVDPTWTKRKIEKKPEIFNFSIPKNSKERRVSFG